jgi:hypothetical protein
MPPRLIHLQPAAPPKPAPGRACNGCGVCCSVEPCPLGIVLTGRRVGACSALQWDPGRARYLCGALEEPRRWLRWTTWLPMALARRLVGRWIGASRGCDSDVEAAPASPAPGPAQGRRRPGFPG